MNSFPLSIWIGKDSNFAKPLLEMAVAIVSASLFGIAMSTAYFLKVVLIHRTTYLLLSAVNICTNKSMCILMLGLYGIGRG
jgi:hypothetical protein